MWVGPDLITFNKFTLTRNYKIEYRAMYEVLCNETETRAALDALCYQLTLASTSAFLISLQNWELIEGFNYSVATVRKGLEPQAFFNITSTGRGVDDLTFVNSTHGRSTHRIQWAMMAAYARKNQGAFGVRISDLYRAMEEQGSAGMQMNYIPKFFGRNFWDFLVDNEHPDCHNATSPEWFCGTFLKDEYPALHACSNSKEPYEKK
jgi:hypothetical protein